MKDTELVQGLLVYEDWLLSQLLTAVNMRDRKPNRDTSLFWSTVADTLTGCLGRLEKEFPFLKEVQKHKENTKHGLRKSV